MPPERPLLENNTFDPSEKSRAYRREQVLGARKIIKKLQKGMTVDQIVKKTGVSKEAVEHLQKIISMQPLPTAETETFIDGKEV